MTPICTRLHRLLSVIDADDLPAWCAGAAHYVIAPDLLAALTREDVQKSISAMIEAGMARLPFQAVLVEFGSYVGTTRFVWLRESDGGFEARCGAIGMDYSTMATEPGRIAIQGGQLALKSRHVIGDAMAMALGVALALLMLNIRGVEKERIEPSRLNKAREAKGRTRIPAHTVLRIGVVYTRDGRPAHGGRPPKVYLRAGHVRQQACGPGWRDHKQVYIEPALVNYRPGDEEPAPRTKIVRMR
jgi:hypothetical protein